MSAALLRLSVVADSRRLDVAVPAALPVAELVPGLARRLGVVSYDGLRLCTATGSVLDDSIGLSRQDVPDGAVLTLAPEPPPPVVHDDPADVLTAGSSDGPPRWLPATGAMLLLLLGAASATTVAQPRPAAIVALLLLAGAIGLGRGAPCRKLVASVAACGYAAVSAGQLVSGLRPGAGVAWAAAGGAALAVASLAMAGLGAQRLRLLPVLVVATAVAAGGAVLSLRAARVGVLAPAALVLVVLLILAVPWLAVGRISRPRGRVDVEALQAEARVARELVRGLTIGLAVVLTALTPVAARAGGGGLALAGCTSGIVLLRARHQASGTEALPGLLSGGAGLLAATGVALWLHQAWRPLGALVLAGTGGILLTVPSRSGVGVLLRPVVEVLEASLLVALLPLLVVATRAWELVA